MRRSCVSWRVTTWAAKSRPRRRSPTARFTCAPAKSSTVSANNRAGSELGHDPGTGLFGWFAEVRIREIEEDPPITLRHGMLAWPDVIAQRAGAELIHLRHCL